jgi:hypothetical protein
MTSSMLATNATSPQAMITVELTKLGLAESIAIYNCAKLEIALTATVLVEMRIGGHG